MSVPLTPDCVASVGALAAWARAALPAPHALFLALGDCAVEVRTSQRELQDALAAYFDEFLCPPPAPWAADILITAHEAPAPELGLALAEKAPDPARPRSRSSGPTCPTGAWSASG
jgi:hypothetical protein